MRYLCHQDPKQLAIKTGELRPLEHDELLIEVAYAGINKPDLLQRLGLYPAPKGASPILGLEVSGVVKAVGRDVDQFKPGDKVCALCNGGGYATEVNVPQGQVFKAGSLTLKDAASLPETWFTCYSNLVDIAKLAKGEQILIHGGAGGIGSTAIQMAKQIGAIVHTTVSSPNKAAFVKSLGADHTYLYVEDFWPQLQKNSQGIDVVLDMVGGDYMQHHINVAKLDGRIVSIAFMGGSRQTLDLLPMMLKRLVLTGSTLRPRTACEKRAIRNGLAEQFWPHIQSNVIKSLVTNTVDFTAKGVEQALMSMKDNQHHGKWVIAINPQLA